MKRIVRGNDFTMRIPVVKIVDGEKVAFPLPGCTDIVVRLCSAYRRLELAHTIDAKEDNVIVARVEGDRIPFGTYALEVRGKIFGNDWRSNEYEQVAIVDRNADADTELGETDEGEDSVEMDTAVVILPPDRELDALVKEALAQNKAMSELSDAIKVSEEGRTKSEELRAKSEEARQEAEKTRANSEAERVQAEQVRENSEGQRVGAEQGRASAESARVTAESARADAENARVTAEQGRVETENVRVTAENARTEAEAARQEAEQARASQEAERAQAEDTRTKTEIEREANELTRKNNEAKRQDNETARQTAEEKREEATSKAVADCEAASTGAEKCNVTMSGSTITVTNRNGEQDSVNVIDADERVTLTVTSGVDSVKASGITVNVYINHDTKSPLKVVTDADGKARFTAKRGEYYEIKLPEFGAAQPIAPMGFTAVLPERSVTATYMPYDKDSSETVTVTVLKYTNGSVSAWASKAVKCTYDGNTTSFATGSNGKVTFNVPLSKQYTIEVEDEDGYSVEFHQNKETYTAELSQRNVTFSLYQYATGFYCVTSDGQAYTIDDWLTTGRDPSEVVAIKVVTYNLITAKGTYAIRMSDLENIQGLPKTKWTDASYFFKSLDGYPQTYYNGQDECIAMRQEGDENGIDTPAADAAYEQTLSLNGKELRGFLPSNGQAQVIIDNNTTLRDMLAKLLGDDTADAIWPILLKTLFWNSHQHNASNAGIFSFRATNFDSRINKFYVLPCFSC